MSYLRKSISPESDHSVTSVDFPSGNPLCVIRMSEVIVSELLCFMKNKFDILDQDSLILLCSRTFSSDDVVNGKNILKSICTDLDVLGNLRIGGRSGADKVRKNLEDICAMLHKLGNAGPNFAASDLRKLPPVTFDNIDVTHLLFRLEKLEAQLASRNEIENRTMGIIEKLEKEISSMKEAEVRTTSLLQSLCEASASANLKATQPKNIDAVTPLTSDVFFTPMKDSTSNEHPNSEKHPNGVPKKFLPKNLPSLKKSGDSNQSNMVPLSLLNKIQAVRKKTTVDQTSESGTQKFSADNSEGPVNETPAQTLQYSEVLRTAVSNGEQWKTVTSKGRKSKLVSGTLAGVSNVKVAVRKSTTYLFTKGWGTDESCQGVINFLKNAHSIIAECTDIETRATVYKCFKITVNITSN